MGFWPPADPAHAAHAFTQQTLEGSSWRWMSGAPGALGEAGTAQRCLMRAMSGGLLTEAQQDLPGVHRG